MHKKMSVVITVFLVFTYCRNSFSFHDTYTLQQYRNIQNKMYDMYIICEGVKETEKRLAKGVSGLLGLYFLMYPFFPIMNEYLSIDQALYISMFCYVSAYCMMQATCKPCTTFPGMIRSSMYKPEGFINYACANEPCFLIENQELKKLSTCLEYKYKQLSQNFLNNCSRIVRLFCPDTWLERKLEIDVFKPFFQINNNQVMGQCFCAKRLESKEECDDLGDFSVLPAELRCHIAGYLKNFFVQISRRELFSEIMPWLVKSEQKTFMETDSLIYHDRKISINGSMKMLLHGSIALDQAIDPSGMITDMECAHMACTCFSHIDQKVRTMYELPENMQKTVNYILGIKQ